MKLFKNYLSFHSKSTETIDFKQIWNWLEAFHESWQWIHVKYMQILQNSSPVHWSKSKVSTAKKTKIAAICCFLFLTLNLSEAAWSNFRTDPKFPRCETLFFGVPVGWPEVKMLRKDAIKIRNLENLWGVSEMNFINRNILLCKLVIKHISNSHYAPLCEIQAWYSTLIGNFM